MKRGGEREIVGVVGRRWEDGAGSTMSLFVPISRYFFSIITRRCLERYKGITNYSVVKGKGKRHRQRRREGRERRKKEDNNGKGKEGSKSRDKRSKRG